MLDLVVTDSGNNTLTVLPGLATNGGANGLFDPLGIGGFTVNLPGVAAQPLPQPIPVPLPPPGNPDMFIPQANGGLLEVAPSLAIAPREVFTPAAGLRPTSFAFDATGQILFVGTDGGGIDVFQEDAGGVYSEPVATTLTEGDLHDISEMAVVSEDSSHFELYATNVGQDNPVVVSLQLNHEFNLPGPQEPSATPIPTSPAPGAPPVVATLTIELVNHDTNPGNFPGDVNAEALNGILVATSLVSFDSSSPDSAGGDGDFVTEEDDPGGNGTDVPTVESFVARLPAQLRAVLEAQQEHGKNPDGFDVQWQTAVDGAFRQIEGVSAGLDGLSQSLDGLFDSVRQNSECLAALGDEGTGDNFEWTALWRPMVGAAQQFGDTVGKVGVELSSEFLVPRPATPPDRPPLLNPTLPKPTGGDELPPEIERPQGMLPAIPGDARIAVAPIFSLPVDAREDGKGPAMVMGLVALLGQVFGSDGPFVGEERERRRLWRPL